MKEINASMHKTNATVTGLFFITATVTAIIGLKLYDPILNSPNYLTDGAKYSNQIVLGAVFELILAVANIGTAIKLFPYLSNTNRSWGLAYLVFRALEVVFILVGIVSVLSLLTLSELYISTNGHNAAYFEVNAAVLKAIHSRTFVLGPNIMLGVNTFSYSYIFYRSGLVPRKLAIMGISGAILVLINGIVVSFDIFDQLSVWGILLVLPIASYEMILAGWLIVKGFRVTSPVKEILPRQVS
ncbi:MAG: hypothetical protein K0Q79_631 [Flavipsychrobacter sp.]|jgi:hypothetical protein|nr:hypothetical protein [Flavipsychrobacter sp.]